MPLRDTDNRRRPENVKQVANGANNNPNTNNNNTGPSRQNDYREHHQSFMVFVTEPMDKQSQHRRAMEVNAVMPSVPRYLNWFEQEVSWSHSDHPKVMPTPGRYALVVDPTFVGPAINTRFIRVLIDNGSSINIMYRDSMIKMGITENMLQPSRTTFHGIVRVSLVHPWAQSGSMCYSATRRTA